MSGSERVLTYEVQVLAGGRWVVHSRYPADAMEKALSEAKELEKHVATADVKVFKEVYNSGTNTSGEFMIYKSGPKVERIKAPPPPKPKKKPPTVAPDDETPLPDGVIVPEALPPRPPPSMVRVLVKLIMITLASVAVGMMLSALVTLFINNADSFGFFVTKQVGANLLFAAFVIGFLLSSVPLAVYYLSRENLNFEFGGRAAPRADKYVPPSRSSGRLEEKMTRVEREEAEHRVAEVMSGQAQSHPDDEPEEQELAPPPPPKKPPVLNAHGEAQKTAMLRYLGEALAAIGSNRKMDNYNKFGVNLFLAGACESLASLRQLDVLSTSRILSESVQALGFKKHQAEGFADKYQDYLLADARYMQMFQAGRAAMEAHIEGQPDAVKALDKSLNDWNLPKEKEQQSSVVTIMFTDMVGSTALTQSLGDAGAQQVVRAHNTIVRNALARNRGKEIKHTGDGIMASFSSTTDSVKAAIEIQIKAEEHTKANPKLPLRLKIGIHSGQAIAEDDDLFGTHVQLAARITDKAGEGEIFVSETAHGICAGKGIPFTNRGQYQFKGFSHPQTIYQVGEDPAELASDKAEREIEEALKKAEEEKKRAAAQTDTPPDAPSPQPQPTQPQTPPPVSPVKTG